MSYADAQRDSVRSERVKGQTYYYPPCQFCGAEVRSWNYLPTHRYTCPACRPYKAMLLKLTKKQ